MHGNHARVFDGRGDHTRHENLNNPGTRNDNVAYFNDIQRGYRQTAFFTSLDFDLIPKVLTVTAGTRCSVDTEKGSVAGSFTCYEAGPGPCLTYAPTSTLKT